MYTLDYFSSDTHKLLHVPEHLRAFGGRSSIGRIDGSVTGVSRFFCPPLNAANLAFRINFVSPSHGIEITDKVLLGHGSRPQTKLQRETYHPSYFYRRGAVHQHLEKDKDISLSVESWVSPSSLDDSFFLKLKVKNLDEKPVSLNLATDWDSTAFEISDGEWAWDAPDCTTEQSEKIGEGLYKSKNAYMALFWSTDSKCGDTASLELDSNEEKEIVLKVAFSKDNDFTAPSDLAEEFESSLAKRENEWADFMERCPQLHTSHKALEKTYMHSLFTMFSCTWRSPNFIMNPFYSEAGMNGNCLCAYTWGDAYVSKITALTETKDYRNFLLSYFNMGLDKHYAFDPVSGEGVGPRYNYNLLAITTAIHDYVKYTGDVEFLTCDAEGMPLYRRLVKLVDEMESILDSQGALLDYGTHHNLLEMRGSGYEHIVPSPNAERVLIYGYIAELLKMFGHEDESRDFTERAEAVRREFTEKLWDEKAMWPKCIYPDMHEETVFTIQGFDLLNRGILSKEREEAIISRVNEDEFLSEYGVNSVSKADVLHFDLGDVDWSGAGAYSGDPCNLVEVLFNMGKTELAWDTAKRLFWWADAYPYWPQSIWVGKQDYSHWEQPCNRAGFAFAQAIVFGMFGLSVKDGEVTFNPHIPAEVGEAHLTNVKLFGKTYSTK